MKHLLFLCLLGCLPLWLAGCAALPSAPVATEKQSEKPEEVVVFAASSLSEVFSALGSAFEERHPQARLVFNLAGSQQLASQLAEGAQADLFASADQRQIEVVVAAGRVDPTSVVDFACNRLVVITNSPRIATLEDLAQPNIKLVLGAEAVPVGAYSLAFLAAAADDPSYGEAFRRGALDNVVSYEQSVRVVLSKVRLGEADAGIVYTTDARSASDVTVLEIPAHLNQIAGYQIAPVRDGGSPILAQQFLNFLRSSQGANLLTDGGFSLDCVPTSRQSTP